MWLNETASYMASEKIMFNLKKDPSFWQMEWI